MVRALIAITVSCMLRCTLAGGVVAKSTAYGIDHGNELDHLNSAEKVVLKITRRKEQDASLSTLQVDCKYKAQPPSFKGKKGACMKNMTRIKMLHPHWSYQWSATTNSTAVPMKRTEFVPMLWSAKNKTAVSLIVNKIMLHDPSLLLGFNEPDRPSQADMSVEQALAMWPALQSSGVPLVSPSCAQSTGEWMKEFMKAVDARCLRVDYIGVHWYGGMKVGIFRERMREIYKTYGRRPLLLTEFAVADWTATSPDDNKFTAAGVLRFMKRALPWLEKQNWIIGYAWFPFGVKDAAGTHSALFDTEGSLTALGRFYASVSAKNPNGNHSITL